VDVARSVGTGAGVGIAADLGPDVMAGGVGAAGVPGVSAETAAERASVPVLPALRPLVPGGALRPGTVVGVDGPGATSLGLALLAGAATGDGWCAAVGLPELGVVAAAEMGADLERLLLVDHPGPRWPEVVATLIDVAELILLRPPVRPDAVARRRLTALARRDRCVLAALGPWEGAAIRLGVADAEWTGLGAGHGHLRGRRALVTAGGRGAAGPGRSARIWLPGPDGTVTTDESVRPAAGVPEVAERRAALEAIA
jgi:hypothetical protein